MNKVLIIGSGAREHAIAKAFLRSKEIEEIIVSPGNGGINNEFRCVQLKSFLDIATFVKKEKLDYVFVGNEQPLADGLIDYLNLEGIKAVGPCQKAAQIESSKVFSKNLMKKYQVATAEYEVFEDYENCLSYLQTCTYPRVLKADGLAAGKGVVIAYNKNEAEMALTQMMLDKKYGEAGVQIVIEEFLTGEEASVFAFTDGFSFVSTIFAQDHKAVYEGDKGPNTGGMGAFAPVDKFAHLQNKVDKEIFEPVLKALQIEGFAFKGVLFAGLMIKDDDVKVIEFNCRLGDPETEVILPLLKTDFNELSQAIINNQIHKIQLSWLNAYAVTVVAASQGYPESFEKGFEITLPKEIPDNSGDIFYAGIKYENGLLKTNGGRVLCTTGFGNSLADAIDKSYRLMEMVSFKNKYLRKDIAQKGLERK